MPRSTRQHLQRIHEQADNDLDRHLENLKNMADMYREHHPDMSTKIEVMASFIVNYQEQWRSFRNIM